MTLPDSGVRLTKILLTHDHIDHAGATQALAERLGFVGDVLFAGSTGRTDFPRGDHATLVRSITSNLWPLANDVTFVPGRGPTSPFGQERATNPFVGDPVLQAG